MSDDSPFTLAFESMRIPVLRTHSPAGAKCPVGHSRADCSAECLKSLEALLAARGGEIATIIVEPLLQGAGGMIVHPEEFLIGIRRLADAYDVLLVADEVLTGFGRTGRMLPASARNRSGLDVRRKKDSPADFRWRPRLPRIACTKLSPGPTVLALFFMAIHIRPIPSLARPRTPTSTFSIASQS